MAFKEPEKTEVKVKHSTTPLYIVIIVLAIALTLTVVFSLYNNQQQNLAIGNLTQQLNHETQGLILWGQAWEWSQLAYHNLSGVYIFFEPATNSISPPISGDQALTLVLQYGGWNVSSLQNATIDVIFGSTSFQPNQTFWDINESYGPISNYSPVQNGNITFRYVWAVQVGYYESSIFGTYYTHISYLVDSATGEVFSDPQGFDYFMTPPTNGTSLASP
jgi:type II secretory pathway pseudopilin PulG